MSSCGSCVHGHLFAPDVTKRICRGGPPQLIGVQTPKGLHCQTMFPVVNASDEACGMHKQKIVLTTGEHHDAEK